MSRTTPIFRFAPSPNGELHAGHAYSALLNLHMARQNGGKMLLRIEDIDQQRCTQTLMNQMLVDLEWIGFEWDEPPERQSSYFDAYADVLRKLYEAGLMYPSALSRSDIKRIVAEKEQNGENWPHDPDGVPFYPGTERTHTLSERPAFESVLGKEALRLDTAKAVAICGTNLGWEEATEDLRALPKKIEAKPLCWGDVILARRDTPTSYHMACVIDDARQEITHVVRGKDLYWSTSIHCLLQTLLDLPLPIYHHHALIHADDGQKLSKSLQHRSLRELRESGMSAQDVRRLIKCDPA